MQIITTCAGHPRSVERQVPLVERTEIVGDYLDLQQQQVQLVPTDRVKSCSHQAKISEGYTEVRKQYYKLARVPQQLQARLRCEYIVDRYGGKGRIPEWHDFTPIEQELLKTTLEAQLLPPVVGVQC